ncbi:TPA: DUF3800 domain-containing protein [Klebsiella variicola]
MDESGNTGDIINRKKDILFSNQPIFSHSCIGLNDENLKKMETFITSLKEEFNIPIEQELKSEDFYFKNPKLILLISLFLVDHNIPIICEVTDKKHNIAIAIVQNLIFPQSEENERPEANVIRSMIAERITEHAPEECFKRYMTMCHLRTEKSFYDIIDFLKVFFSGSDPQDIFALKMIEMTIDDYEELKKENNIESAAKYFMMLPDFDSSGNEVKMLPLVYSFYNIAARLNKRHKKNLKNIKVIHDTTYEYSKTLKYCLTNILKSELKNKDSVPNSDYELKETFQLYFEDSKNSIGIQVADLVAGFLQRYINGTLYKQIKVENIYHGIFELLIKQNQLNNPLGVNFVLPETKRYWLFHKFDL